MNVEDDHNDNGDTGDLTTIEAIAVFTVIRKSEACVFHCDFRAVMPPVERKGICPRQGVGAHGSSLACLLLQLSILRRAITFRSSTISSARYDLLVDKWVPWLCSSGTDVFRTGLEIVESRSI
jgi:hypothetical protein